VNEKSYDYKLSELNDDLECTYENMYKEYTHGNMYEHRVYSDWSTVVVAPNKNQIQFILDIAKEWPGPFLILYVLIASRCDHEIGRYQLANTVSYKELESFLDNHKEYFEKDGRHHLWVIDITHNNRIIYDNHNIIYIYGDDKKTIKFCEHKGLKKNEISIHTPHTHNFNEQYDTEENYVFNNYEWIQFPLEEDDDP
jgi:hypothetical protein